VAAGLSDQAATAACGVVLDTATADTAATGFAGGASALGAVVDSALDSNGGRLLPGHRGASWNLNEQHGRVGTMNVRVEAEKSSDTESQQHEYRREDNRPGRLDSRKRVAPLRGGECCHGNPERKSRAS
jgi:hypothetical protein